MGDMIVCLVGKSGTGKTTIAYKLRHKYNVIQSYTTRPKRFDNEWGHIFMDADYNIPYHNSVAYTYFDGYRYWATREQYRHKGISIYVIDVRGVKVLKDKINDAKVITIYLECNFFIRFIRLVKRDGILKSIKRIYEDVKSFNYDKSNYDYIIKSKGNIDDIASRIRTTILLAINYKRS